MHNHLHQQPRQRPIRQRHPKWQRQPPAQAQCEKPAGEHHVLQVSFNWSLLHQPSFLCHFTASLLLCEENPRNHIQFFTRWQLRCYSIISKLLLISEVFTPHPTTLQATRKQKISSCCILCSPGHSLPTDSPK